MNRLERFGALTDGMHAFHLVWDTVLRNGIYGLGDGEFHGVRVSTGGSESKAIE
ncbi:hypothetical protein FM101_05155 [Arthrobacter rhombi]|uniref:Uncharacterized protein n=1 Tax=Arthrobacter rhombi TaxID=71253 RepID=A0A1R4FPX2_9MICC|nr:hypothetical protein FM101_05155 [Arthrobacter rhombi]